MRIGRYSGEFAGFWVKFFDFWDVVGGGDSFWGIGEIGNAGLCAQSSRIGDGLSEEKEKAGAG
jgi:hypothetical protein